jgi:putative DNA primase/helicase
MIYDEDFAVPFAPDTNERIMVSLSDEQGKLNPYWYNDIAEYINGLHKFVSTDNRTLYMYDEENGYWSTQNEIIIAHEFQKIVGKIATEKNVREAIAYIKRMHPVNLDFFEKDKNFQLINLKNGVYDMERKELLEHSPDYKFLYVLPIEYNKDAFPSHILKFLEEVSDGDPRKMFSIFEVFAYSLVNGYPIQKAVMFFGSGANGKSTTLNILTKLIGLENTSSLTLQQITDRPFVVHRLSGKLINIAADLPSKEIEDSSLFKNLTGGNESGIDAEVKFKNETLKLRNHAKMYFSANQIPMTWDNSDAYFRRWFIIEFTKKFEERTAKKDIINELTTPEELSGLFNVLVDVFLPKITKTNDFNFTFEDNTKKTAEIYELNSNPVQAFINQKCYTDPEAKTPKDEIWSAFVSFCKRKGLPVPSDKLMKLTIQRLGLPVREGQTTIEEGGVKERIRVWVGLALSPESEEDSEKENLKVKEIPAIIDDYASSCTTCTTCTGYSLFKACKQLFSKYILNGENVVHPVQPVQPTSQTVPTLSLVDPAIQDPPKTVKIEFPSNSSDNSTFPVIGEPLTDEEKDALAEDQI